jgi:GH24 family phage-related lysozyme (muramidase)
MRILILFIFLNMHLGINSGALLHKAKKINLIIEVDNYHENYQKTIEYLKVNEGFSDSIYNDNGYQAIGYGQRINFYSEKIPSKITRFEAEIILKKSFGNHQKMVKKLWPKLNKNKQLALSHISYTVGIGRLIKLMKNNQLDSVKLLKIGKKSVREFELKLYNDGRITISI